MFGQCGPKKPCSTPFGGPGSGLWPSSGAAESAGPRVLGRPAPSCVLADLFADCFTACLTPAACGWTVISPPPTVSFNGDQMIIGRVGMDATGEAFKALLATMPFDFTVQYKFSEMLLAPPGADQTYQVDVSDATGLIVLRVSLSGGGAVLVNVSGAQFSGVWTPLGAGAPHTVHCSWGGGIPFLVIDGGVIGLAPIPPASFSQAPDTMLARVMKVGAPTLPGEGVGAFDWIFVATGVLPPSTVFCCPGGGPPQ